MEFKNSQNQDPQIDTKKSEIFRNIYVDLTSKQSQKLMDLAVREGAKIIGFKYDDSRFRFGLDDLMKSLSTTKKDQEEFKSIFLLLLGLGVAVVAGAVLVCKAGILQLSINGQEKCSKNGSGSKPGASVSAGPSSNASPSPTLPSPAPRPTPTTPTTPSPSPSSPSLPASPSSPSTTPRS